MCRYLVALCMAQLCALAAAQGAPASASPVVAEVANGPVYSLPFLWQQDDGATVRLDHWAGHEILIAMAYSSCRETCSFTMHRLEQLARTARSRNRDIEIIVVSYDPRVDDAHVWSSYRRRHGLKDSRWHFLVGSDEATHVVAKLLGLPFWNYEEHVMHEFGITLVDTSGHIDRVLGWANRNEDLFAARAAPCVASDSRGCKS